MADRIQARIRTTAGDIIVSFFDTIAPRAFDRFCQIATGTLTNSSRLLAHDGSRRLYNGVTLYSVRAGFVTHTALPASDEAYSLPEGPTDRPGRGFDAAFLVGMARTHEMCRFFVTTRPTPWMNGQHALLGQVSDEQSRLVVNSIGFLQPGLDPRMPATIENVTIADEGQGGLR